MNLDLFGFVAFFLWSRQEAADRNSVTQTCLL